MFIVVYGCLFMLCGKKTASSVRRRRHSLARVVGGVLGTVSRAVAAEETGGVLGGDGGVLAGPPSLGFHPRPLQDVVRVLTCSWMRNQNQKQS